MGSEMCIRDSGVSDRSLDEQEKSAAAIPAHAGQTSGTRAASLGCCLLYTSDAADERSSVDLGGRRIIKKKTHGSMGGCLIARERMWSTRCQR